MGDVTELLHRIRAGDDAARDELIELVYDEIRQLAGRAMANERPDHSLQPTAVVHEVYLRLFHDGVLKDLENRAHFFGAVSRAIRRVLREHARARAAQKRGGHLQRSPLDELAATVEEHVDVAATDEALEKLSLLNPRQSQVITLRFLLGFTVAEVAEMLGVSASTVEGDFRKARAFLYGELHNDH